MPLARTSSFVPSAAASSTSEATTAVTEHVVFFGVKDGTGEETKRSFIQQVTKLGSLDGVIQILSAEPLKPSGDFFGVYTRFADKSFIGLHQALMKDFVGPHFSNVVDHCTSVIASELSHGIAEVVSASNLDDLASKPGLQAPECTQNVGFFLGAGLRLELEGRNPNSNQVGVQWWSQIGLVVDEDPWSPIYVDELLQL